MLFIEKLKKVQELQKAIESYGKLPDEIIKRINYKFRLEWNYYSNKMEGNSLTRQETRTVMVGNITIDGKPIKDVLEMKGHDDVISNIIKMGAGELNISEKRIKDIHRGIMHEDDPTKVKFIAEWKNEPNYLYNYKKERFDFVAPADVKDRMHQLINWLNTEKEKIHRNDKNAITPLQLAFQFHVDYLTIHPFYDGNGRTARILTNLILISYGYPPIYIKEEEKVIYYQYLADIQGYGGEPGLFYDFMTGLLLRSMQIVIDAAEGRVIEEAEDLDKKLFLLEKELDTIDQDEVVKQQLNAKVFFDIYHQWLSELIGDTIQVVQKFNKFFEGVSHYINIEGKDAVISNFINEPPSVILSDILQQLNRQEHLINTRNIKVIFVASYGAFIKGGLKTFGCNYGWEINFDKIKYEIKVDEFAEINTPRQTTKLPERLLHKPLSKSEIDFVTNKLGDTIYQHIDFYTKKNKLR